MNKLRERIRVLMKAPDYQPLNKSEFARTLQLKPNERSELRAELLRLEGKGLIVRGKKGRFELKSRSGNTGEKPGHQPQRPPAKSNFSRPWRSPHCWLAEPSPFFHASVKPMPTPLATLMQRLTKQVTAAQSIARPIFAGGTMAVSPTALAKPAAAPLSSQKRTAT